MRALLQKIIQYASKAPSHHYKQPWKFRTEGCSLIIYPDYTHSRRLEEGDYHELFIALGCAVENAVVAANAFGYREMVTCRFSGETDCVRITLEPADTSGNQGLFLAIGDRPPMRDGGRKQAIPADLMASLALQARERDVFLKIYDTEEEFRRLLPLVEEAAVLQFRDQEYPAWVRFPHSGPGASDGEGGRRPVKEPAVPNWFDRLYRAHQVSAHAAARRSCEQVKDSAALVLFATTSNTKEGWVNLGRSYGRMALGATALGIRQAPLSGLCEEPAVRQKLKRDLGYTTEEPLLLIRLGYAETGAESLEMGVQSRSSMF